MEGKAPCEGSIHLLEDPPAASAKGTRPPPPPPRPAAAAAAVEDEDWSRASAEPSLLEVAPGNKTACRGRLSVMFRGRTKGRGTGEQIETSTMERIKGQIEDK